MTGIAALSHNSVVPKVISKAQQVVGWHVHRTRQAVSGYPKIDFCTKNLNKELMALDIVLNHVKLGARVLLKRTNERIIDDRTQC